MTKATRGAPLLLPSRRYCLDLFLENFNNNTTYAYFYVLYFQLQHAPASRGRRLPSSLVSKGFTFSNGKISLEVTLDKEIYYHGEKVAANIIVSNNSRKSVRNIRCMVVQHVEITMINSQFSRHVASLESREGCPVTPGASLSKTFYLVPLARSNKDIRGMK